MNWVQQSDKQTKSMGAGQILLCVDRQIETRSSAGMRQDIEALLHDRLSQLRFANRFNNFGDTIRLWHLDLRAYDIREDDEFLAG